MTTAQKVKIWWNLWDIVVRNFFPLQLLGKLCCVSDPCLLHTVPCLPKGKGTALVNPVCGGKHSYYMYYPVQTRTRRFYLCYNNMYCSIVSPRTKDRDDGWELWRKRREHALSPSIPYSVQCIHSVLSISCVCSIFEENLTVKVWQLLSIFHPIKKCRI